MILTKELFPIKRANKYYLFYNKPASFFEISKTAFDLIDLAKKTNQNEIPSEISGYLKEFDNVTAKIPNLKSGTKTARLRLEISNVCNNKCLYCHVFRISKNGSKNTFLPYESSKRLITEYLYLLKKFNISSSCQINFYGGEPLLAWASIEKLLTNFGNSNNGIELSWSINTNGRLLDLNKIQFLKQYGVELHIGCDGPKDVNDKARRSEENNGTFDEIMKAFRMASKHGIYKQIDSVISVFNMNRLRELIQVAKDNFIDFIYLDLLYKPGKLLDIPKTIQAYRDAIHFGRSKKVRVGGCCTSLLHRIRSRATRFPNNKYDFLRSITVAANEGIYPSISRNTPITFGSLKDYFTEENKKWKNDFNEISTHLSQACSSCFLKDYCGFSGIIQYQYHTKQETGFEESCNFLKEFILTEMIDEAIN